VDRFLFWQKFSGLHRAQEQTPLLAVPRRIIKEVKMTWLLFGDGVGANLVGNIPIGPELRWLSVRANDRDLILVATDSDTHHADLCQVLFHKFGVNTTVNVDDERQCPWAPLGDKRFIVWGGGFLRAHNDGTYEILARGSTTFPLVDILQAVTNKTAAIQMARWTQKKFTVKQ
jgi:hypothetical protein